MADRLYRNNRSHLPWGDGGAPLACSTAAGGCRCRGTLLLRCRHRQRALAPAARAVLATCCPPLDPLLLLSLLQVSGEPLPSLVICYTAVAPLSACLRGAKDPALRLRQGMSWQASCRDSASPGAGNQQRESGQGCQGGKPNSGAHLLLPQSIVVQQSGIQLIVVQSTPVAITLHHGGGGATAPPLDYCSLARKRLASLGILRPRPRYC